MVTPALHPVLPANNILGAPAGEYLSAAHGRVALLDPLPPGTHTIFIDGVKNDDGTAAPSNTTTIVVKPGH